MSDDKLHAVTAARDAWEVARACLWHRINELLATKGTARLREKHGEQATLLELPAGVTLARALSALRVAARGLALHLDVPDSFPWLVLGRCALTLTADSIEYELQRLFTGSAADDADFWEREIVAPTMERAEEIRAALRAEWEAAAPVGRSGAPKKYPRALEMALDLLAKGEDKDCAIYRKCKDAHGRQERLPKVDSFMRTVRREARKRRGQS